MKFRIHLFLSFILVFAVQAESKTSFSNYSTSDGLVHKTVYCLLRDSEGFLWVGTTSGLSRFDGYDFYNFVHSDDNPLSLHGISIEGMVAGKEGRIWLSTDAGLEYFDKEREEFHLIDIPQLKNKQFHKDISIDSCGYLWLYSQHTQLIAYDPLTNTIVDSLVNGRDFDISEIYHFVINRNAVWIAAASGIYSFDLATRKLNVLENGKLCYCYTINTADENTVLMTFMYEGIYIIDTKNQTGRWVNKEDIEKKAGTNTAFFNAMIDADSTLWIGVAPGLISVKDHTVEYYNHYTRKLYFEGDVVPTIYRDSDNSIWFGTYETGLYLKRESNEYLSVSSRLYSEEIEKSIISHLNVFDNGSLIYSDHRGVFLCDSYNNLNVDCAHLLFDISNAMIFPIDGRYCFINSNDTLFTFDSHTQKLARTVVSSGTAVAYRDKNEVVWLGTWEGMILGFDLKNDKKYQFYVDSVQKEYISAFAMTGDDNGSLWIGTYGAGLMHISNPTSAQPVIEYFRKNSSDLTSINSNIIHSFYQDSLDCLWIATNGGGLNKLNKRTKTFESFMVKDGLQSNLIESVIGDLLGNIWFVSSVLTKYNIETKSFTHYSKADGIAGSYAANQCARSIDGKLFFANSTGVLRVDPLKAVLAKPVSVPQLTRFRIRGVAVNVGDTLDGVVPYQKSITYLNELTLPYFLNSFSIEFASIQLQETQSISYEYMLDGIDETWVPSDIHSRLASYSGLQPGTYTLNVRATSNGQPWTEAKTIKIIITPPWWKTWQFILIVVILSIVSVYLIVASRFKAIKKINIMLEEKVTERTELLVVTNETLKEHQKFVELKNQQLHEVLESRDELISVLGHDFRNPLSGLLGIATLLKSETNKAASDKIKHYTDSILTITKTLTSQMLAVLDWAQGQSEQVQVSPIEISIEMLLVDSIALVTENANQKNIRITTQIDCLTNAFIDPQMISTVFRNLLSNAIKFTSIGGSVVVMVHEFETTIDVTFIDTGIGIDKDKQANVFSSYRKTISSYGTENEKGTGLGLHICKSFVEKNNGILSFSSESGRGSTFTVSLPKGVAKAAKMSFKPIDDAKPSVAAVEANRGTLLIIDDNAEIIEIIQSLLGAQYTCIKTQKGDEGLYLAQSSLPDLIICDINLPEISGFEICKILKNSDLTSHIPFLLITSQASKEVEAEAYLSGANDFIQKPFNALGLKRKIESIINSAKKTDGKTELSGDIELPISHQSKIVNKVIELVQNNISDSSLEVNSVAVQIGVSRAQLYRIFKNTTGKTVGEFIHETRMQLAVKMIITGKYRISEVAFEVGYSDPKYFAKCFSKEFGMSPSAYGNVADKDSNNRD